MESILDKILTQKHGQQIRAFDPIEIITSLLKKLPDRENEVIRRRYGIPEGREEETLEEIGSKFKVTRERVRQITKTALHKLAVLAEQDDEVQRFLRVAEQLLGSYGGALSDKYFIDELLEFSGIQESSPHRLRSEQCLRFLIEEVLGQQIIHRPADDRLANSYALPSANFELLNSIAASILNIIDNNKKPMAVIDLVAKFRQEPIYKSNYDILIKQPVEVARDFSDSGLVGQEVTPEEETKVVLAYAALVQGIDHNIFNEWGRADWSLIKPRRMNDKIYLILKHAQKPLHFTEIANQINAIKFDKKIARPPSVHNELILDKRFVLVGRGLYALKEWGFEPGTVADVIVELLADGKTMTRNEIVDSVLEKRMVKKQTIHLALMNKQKFVKSPEGKYRLVQEEASHGGV